MTNEQFYMDLQFDLSGARSKNRFRNELLWGLERIFEVYKTGKDFNVIFDYVCDIEIHLISSFEFYQVKTHNNASPYTLKQILKPDDTGKSVLGKLYILKFKSDEKNKKTKIAIVSNTALKDSDNKLYSTCCEKDFSSLSDTCKSLINEKLKNELELENDLDLNNVCYIYTSMDLFNPQDSLIGKTVKFFDDVKGTEPKKPLSLFRMLFDTISEKASYELEATDYVNLVNKKGLTRANFDQMLDTYTDIVDVSVSNCINYINQTYTSYKQRNELKKSLSKIVSLISKSDFLKQMEIKIANYIKAHFDELDMDLSKIVDKIFKNYVKAFSIEYSPNEIKSFILLILMRFEEDIYE